MQSHGNHQLDYQYLSTGWLPASEEEQKQKVRRSFAFAHGARRIPSCEVAWTEQEKNQETKELQELQEVQKLQKSNQETQGTHRAAGADGSTVANLLIFCNKFVKYWDLLFQDRKLRLNCRRLNMRSNDVCHHWLCLS